jgi:hypothetical protein
VNLNWCKFRGGLGCCFGILWFGISVLLLYLSLYVFQQFLILLVDELFSNKI